MFLRSLLDRLPFGWAVRLAFLRLIAQWQSLLTIVVGVLLAAVIGANAPLYTTAVAQVGMVQRLAQQPSADVHVFSRISITSEDVDEVVRAWAAVDAAVRDQVDRVFESAIPGWAGQTVQFGESTPMLVIQDGEDIPATRMRAAYYGGWRDVLRLVEGIWPVEAAPEGEIEVVIGLSAAISLNLSVGDVIVLDQRGWESSQPVPVRITGIVAPVDEDAAYWMAPDPLRTEGAGEWDIETNLLMSQADFTRVVEEFIPQTRSVLGWRVLFDHTRLPFSETPRAVALLEGFEKNLEALLDSPSGPQLNFVYSTGLVPLFEAYASEVSLLGAPFGLLLLQIGALVLFFLVATATLVRRGERRELAMLQSRGAFDRQLILLRGVEALFIMIFGAVLAPVVAQYLLIWLAPVFTGITRLPLLLDPTVFIYSGLAAGAAFVALMATLRPVLRQPLILAGGSAARSESQPWWQKYYLDVGLIVVGGAALWRLVSTDSPLAATQLGSVEADPLLLMAPALLFVALGSVLLRLFPELMNILSRVLARRRDLGGALATWQVSREPVHYGRITFLLALAIGIGWFATSFRATVDRSHTDQARYQIGTDVRLEERDIVLDVDRARPLDMYQSMPDVVAASQTLRFFNLDISNDRQDPVAGELLAVDADTFGDVLYWRSDLGPVLAPRAPGEPLDLPETGAALPFTPARIGLWARVDQLGFSFSSAGLYRPDLDRLVNRMQIWLRLRDSDGIFVHVPFEAVEVEWQRLGTDTLGLNMRSFNTTGWVYFEAALTDLEYAPQGDLRLDAIYWSHRGRNARQENDLRLSLADLTLIDADGAVTALDWLEDDGWEVVYDSGAPIEGSTFTAAAPDRPLLVSRQVLWDQRGANAVFGLVFNYPAQDAIPAIASDTLLAQNGLALGDRFTLINVGGVRPTVQILDSTTYYPTLYGDQRPFLVVDQEALLYELNRRPSVSVYPTETWLRLAPGVTSTAFMENVDAEGDSSVVLGAETLDRAMRTLQTNPLSLGLMGLLFLAFIVALALTVVGLMTYAALTAQGRRSEFGVLRALGLSSTRLVLSLALEQVLVIATGTGLGALLGILLADRVVPTLAIGATGEAITPPFVVQVEVAALAQYGVIMLIVLAAVLAASLLLVRRLSLTQSLRLGEE